MESEASPRGGGQKLMQGIEVEYSMKSVRNILENFFHFRTCMDKGNIDAIIIITDIMEASKKAKLTPRQKQVFYYRFMLEYTQKETADILGITQSTALEHIEDITIKIYRLLNGMELRKPRSA
jgi:DNA-directed RNA polymerase specialized sigma subunit